VAEPDSQDAINQREWESSWNWSERGFYSSPVDSRLFVPSRRFASSGRVAMNFGHPHAKLIIGAFAFVVCVLIVLVLTAHFLRH
jgi:uncharacterized membrane protein